MEPESEREDPGSCKEPVGFDWEGVIEVKDKRRRYEGKALVVEYDAKRCIHVAECVHGLPSVFEKDRRPWVDADGAEADRVAEVVVRCPTGALHFQRKDGGTDESKPDDNIAILEADGPVYVKGDIEIVDGEGALKLRDVRVAFCRCGASQNKPFCDGRHSDAGFSASGDVVDPKPRPEEFSPGQRLTITPLANGSLRAEGVLEVRSSDGRQTSYHDTRVHLCRCGASKRKPFCDGTHKETGFTAG
jgi:CDGSH-type Zn-finger protein/uncharacterized Fe-S cluster protein YjdI